MSGYTNQPTIQVAVLQSLAHSIHSGQYTGAIGKPTKLVLVGHSFGSTISAGALTLELDLADGVVLTGILL
jgi:pimeloyl-ACP methyl ester carboxylesterase